MRRIITRGVQRGGRSATAIPTSQHELMTNHYPRPPPLESRAPGPPVRVKPQLGWEPLDRVVVDELRFWLRGRVGVGDGVIVVEETRFCPRGRIGVSESDTGTCCWAGRFLSAFDVSSDGEKDRVLENRARCIPPAQSGAGPTRYECC